MSVAETVSQTIQGIFSSPTMLEAQASTTSLAQRVSSEPVLVLFVLAAGLSVCAFLMALVVFFRRTPSEVGLEIVEERLLAIEALLRDHAAARALLTKRLNGDVEYFRRELSDIRLSVEQPQQSTTALKRVANG